ncbi:lipopolysaccharide N-acetylglucosaminyl transferase [Burkholderia sp. Ac-20353]|uniref:tetratricopeptide repeat protein n=1 Tax=Burkholderia sp. Ac-20353 TaxID=2703894 RepID=UPI00197C2521|nr:lipopolysaccharide N-acetylglucosaminyl transferase [Burkholderia sp. Ac-20353]MBN3790122.1 lipopolysaccharide N-acetylglucosaminyl transferase [Burkholderia sp. Ac-20353]
MKPPESARAARHAHAHTNRAAPVATAAPRRPASWPGLRTLRATRDAGRSAADAIARLASRVRAFAFPRLDEGALIELVREPRFAPHLLATLSYAHEHEVKEGLMNRRIAVGHRMTALVAMRTMPVRAASPILHALLNDPADDVRLLAYGMLDKSEKRVTQQIGIARAKLSRRLSDDERYRVDKTLAELYCELVYARLVDGDVFRNALEQADAHAARALHHRPGDGALWRLRGRLAFEADRLDDAEAMLTQAITCGYPRMRVLPYLAEIAYRRRDYAAVRRHLDGMPPVPPHLLAPIADYWNT